MALNGPAGAPAASRGPLYDPRNPPQTMRLAGTAADASSAMKQVAQNPGAFTGTTGYGKLGQVAAPAPANTNLTGTSAVPYTDPATGKTQVGFVTVGNPNAPDPLAGVGGTGEVRNGIPLQKDAKGNFVPAVSGPPLPPPKALDLPSSPGASGPTYDPANPPSLDRASQQAIVAQYPEVGNAGSWANTAFKAGLKPGQNTAADAQNTLDRLTKPDPAPTPAPAIAQNPTLPTPSFGSIPGPMYKFPQPLPGDTAAKQTPDAPAFNLGTGAPAAAPLLPTAPTANSRGGFGGFQQGVDNAVAGISNLGPTTTVGDLQGPAQHGSFMNVIRSVTGAFTSPPPDQTVGAATTGAPGTATNIAKNNNLGSPDTSFQRTAPSGLTTNNTSATPTVAGGPTTPNATPAQGLTSGGSLDSATSTVAGGPVTPNARPAQGLTSGGGLGAATSTVAGGPTTPNAQPAQGLTSGGSMDAATPTVAGGATTPNARPAQGLTAGGSLDAATPTVAGGATTPNAKPAQGLTTGTLGNSGGLTSGSLTSTAGSALASAPTAGDALAGAPSAADSLNAASLYHPAKFSGDPAAATNPFGTAQPLTLGSTVSTDGMYHGGFPRRRRRTRQSAGRQRRGSHDP